MAGRSGRRVSSRWWSNVGAGVLVLPVAVGAAAPTVAAVPTAVPTSGTTNGVAWAVLPPLKVSNRPIAITDDGRVVGNAYGVATYDIQPWWWQAGRLQPLDLATAAWGSATDASLAGAAGYVYRWAPDEPPGGQAVRWRLPAPEPVDAVRPEAQVALPIETNDRGDVVLNREATTRPRRAELHTAAGRTVIEPPPGDEASGTSAAGLNDRRELVVDLVPENGEGRRGVFIWRAGRYTPLGPGATRPDEVTSRSGLSDTGFIAWTGRDPATGRNRVWLTRDGVDVALSAPSEEAAIDWQRRAVNDRGDVVGTVERDDGSTGVVLWRNGRRVDVGGTEPGDRLPVAGLVINDRGAVLVDGGYSTLGSFVWIEGRRIPLPTPPGMSSPSFVDLNDRGQVVGYAYPTDEPGAGWRTVVWTLPR